MSYIFPSDQDRGDDELLNEACEHIEELMDQLASRHALEGKAVRGYSYELATCTDEDGEYCNWSLSISHQKPNVPADIIRNLESLYTHPASDVPCACDDSGMCKYHGDRSERVVNFQSANVPEGWIIEPFDDGFGVEGISVLWPGDRGGAHLRPNDSKNSIAQNLLYDLADALLFDSPASDRPGLGQRKADQVGTTIGVLVQNKDGEVAAVTDLGRVTWLPNDVVAPPKQEQGQ